MRTYKSEYSIEKFNFQEILQEFYNVSDLHTLHQKLETPYSVDEGLAGLGNDTDSIFHKLFYDKAREGWPEFINLYNQFITEVIVPKIDLLKDDQSIIYQTLPSYRIQYPSSKAITTVHCDSDENHKHPEGEINILVPLTTMDNTTAIWAESEPEKGDFKPMNCKYGEYYIWNGNKCRHFNKPNSSGLTRISMDFRVLPRLHYNENYQNLSATSKRKFVIGDYYSELKA